MRLTLTVFRHQRGKPCNRRGFSLIELLVVVAIMAIVAALAVPAFNQIGKGQSLSNAGNHVVELLGVARQNSMTRNCLTVLLIPSGANQWDACILYELRPKADGTAPATGDWQPLSKWEPLPSGITIDETTFADQSAQLPVALPEIKRAGTKIAEYRLVAFMPRGTLYPATVVPPGSNPSLRLVQGQRTGGNLVYTSAATGGTPANFYKIIILSSTGVTKIERP